MFEILKPDRRWRYDSRLNHSIERSSNMKLSFGLLFGAWVVCSGCVALTSGDDTSSEIDMAMRAYRDVACELNTDDIVGLLDGVMTSRESEWIDSENANCLRTLRMADVTFESSVFEDCDGLSRTACVHMANNGVYVATNGVRLIDVYYRLGHEYIHLLGRCFYGDPDLDHARYDLWMINNSDDGLEITLRREIWRRAIGDLCNDYMDR